MVKVTEIQIFEYLCDSVSNCDDGIRKETDLNEAVSLTEDRDYFAHELIKHVLENKDALLAYYQVNDAKATGKPSLTESESTPEKSEPDVPAKVEDITSANEDV